MKEGRFFQPGLNELIVGRNVPSTYAGLNLGDNVRFGGGNWSVVGVFDAGGSAFDSEVWCDAHVLSQVYKRPDNIFSSITVRLTSPAALTQLKDSLTSDPTDAGAGGSGNRLLREAIARIDDPDHGTRNARGGSNGNRRDFWSAEYHVLGCVRKVARNRDDASHWLRCGSDHCFVYFRGAFHFFDWRGGGLRGDFAVEWIHDERDELADIFAPGFCVSSDAAAAGDWCWVRAFNGTGGGSAAGDSGCEASGGAGVTRIVEFSR